MILSYQAAQIFCANDERWDHRYIWLILLIRAREKFTRLCFLENKVKLFQEQYPNVQIENFYTDSMNDRAMMDISNHVFLVKKNQVTQIK